MSDLESLFLSVEAPADVTPRSAEIINPATSKVVGRVCFASEAECDAAIELAARAFSTFSQITPIKRAKILYRLRELLIEHTDELSHLITQEHGKVLADAKGEVMRAIECVEHCCAIPQLLQGQYSSDVANHMDCYTLRQPVGVCVGITPFNFPVMISVWLAIPAIACGNTVIIKPSEKNPSSVFLIAKLLQAAGLPDGVFNVINGDKEVVDYLIRHDAVSAVNCVGSTPVAKYIYQTAVQHNKRAQAFGSAKNHAIVMPDANIEDVIPALAGAGFGAAGERCMAITVVVCVGDAVADKVVAGLTMAASNLTITNGLDEAADMGPLISAEHRQRVVDFIECGVNEGATLVVDGREHACYQNDSGFFLGATIFDQVKPEMKIYQQEIFGPVVCVLRVPDYATAERLVNQHAYANGVALFTQNGAVARKFARNIQVGMVGINVPIPVPVAYHAFGGWRNSSFGTTGLHGQEGIQFYTRSKSVTTTWPQQEEVVADFTLPVND